MARDTRTSREVASLALMIIISCLTQVLTLMKSSVVAGKFGASEMMDAYNFANSFVSLIFGIIAGGIPTVLIPCYVNGDKQDTIDGFITLVYGVLLFVIILMIILRHQIVGLFSNRSELFVNIACNILVVLICSQYISSITSITSAFFQCIGKYNIPKIINFFSQIIVVLLLIFIKNITIYQYAIILTAGVLFNFAFDTAIAFWCGWRYTPMFDIRNNDIKRLFYIFIPTLFSSGVYQLSLFVDSTIASRLEIGKLTILSYANQITGMVNAVLIGNLLIYAYPRIIKEVKESNGQTELWKQADYFHLIICLVVAGFIAVGREGISLFFEHGLLDSQAAGSIYLATAIYILGQQSNVIRDLIYRYFYAIGDTRVTAKNSIFVSAINIVISILLAQYMGLYGIVLGTVISSVISLMLICLKFHNRIGFCVPVKKVCKRFSLNFGIAIITTVVVLLTKNILIINNNLFAVLIYGVETIVIFMLLSFSLKHTMTFA